MISFWQRVVRHCRLSWASYRFPQSPPFLILFVNSTCNMQCEHCFYWRNLNSRDDLTLQELVDLSESLGRIENLNLSGGEPFIRKDLAAVCRQFIQRNRVRQIYIPTNGYFTDKTVATVEEILTNPELDLIAIELSLDGMQEYHDRFRVSKGSFERSMQTYDALAKIQARDPRLRIHAISTATAENIDEIRQLTQFLYQRCPQMDHHNLAIIRGDRKNPNLAAPLVPSYGELYAFIQKVWALRETQRYGAIVEPLLQETKRETLRRQTQIAPCTAGKLSGVVYSNGDVSVCELHKPLGNLRERTFPEIWKSSKASSLRQSIANKDCWCTTEVFLWPSIVFQPLSLARSLMRSFVLKRRAPADAALAVSPFEDIRS